jgi:UDP-GlcNAc3NAcA epimerase
MAIKLITIIGARPQIIKAAAISRSIEAYFNSDINEVIVHTGQHYDQNMSEVFFDELNIPRPDYNLKVGSGRHGAQTAKMTEGIEKLILSEKPDYILLYGDTNSTLAGAVAASKIYVPVVHVEAGLRSFNRKMPEEINRIVCDHLSTLLFSPTETGYQNLQNEGFNARNQPKFTPDNPGIFHCGDVMYDNTIFFSQIAEKKSTINNDLGIGHEDYILATIHRNNNTDDSERLSEIFNSFFAIIDEKKLDIILPVHPRTKKTLQKKDNVDLWNHINKYKKIHLIDPVSFLDMILLEKHASLIMTDSGGVQKEAYFFNKPCIILRPETEWVEMLKTEKAILADANSTKIVSAFKKLYGSNITPFPKIFGDGHAAEFIVRAMVNNYFL